MFQIMVLLAVLSPENQGVAVLLVQPLQRPQVLAQMELRGLLHNLAAVAAAVVAQHQVSAVRVALAVLLAAVVAGAVLQMVQTLAQAAQAAQGLCVFIAGKEKNALRKN
jgi:hypothetical protein